MFNLVKCIVLWLDCRNK